MEKTRVQLITRQPFYAVMLQKCIFSWNEQVKTAGVRVNSKGQVELVVCKSFFESLSEEQRIGLLMHEMLHLLMGHLSRGKDLDTHIANIAMDIAINQFIPSEMLPPGALLPHLFHLHPGKSFEVYYLDLLEKAQKQQKAFGKGKATPGQGQGQPGQGSGDLDISQAQPLDNHDWDRIAKELEKQQSDAQGQGQDEVDLSDQPPGFGELPPELEQAAIEAMIKDAVSETREKFPGKLPLHLERLLPQEKAPAKANWRQLLKQYIGKNLANAIESTRNRPNRRMGLSAPGNRRPYCPKIVIACDQSGSVSDAQVSKLLNECRGILATVADKTEVVFFDTKVAHTEMLTQMKDLPKRYACGGTSFQAAIEYAEKRRPDLMIMLTDGEDNVHRKPRFPILWVISGRYKNEQLPGRQIQID